MKRSWVAKLLLLALVTVSVGFVFADNASAAWYKCVVDRLQIGADGKIVMRVTPAAGEVGFVGYGVFVLETASPATNRLLAMSLTALTMDYLVSIDAANPPSTTMQPILGFRTPVAP